MKRLSFALLLVGCVHPQVVELPQQLPTEQRREHVAIGQDRPLASDEADSMIKQIHADERWHNLAEVINKIENWSTGDLARMLNYTLWASIVRMQHAKTQEEFARFRHVFDAAETLVMEWERTVKEFRERSTDVQGGLGVEP